MGFALSWLWHYGGHSQLGWGPVLDVGLKWSLKELRQEKSPVLSASVFWQMLEFSGRDGDPELGRPQTLRVLFILKI